MSRVIGLGVVAAMSMAAPAAAAGADRVFLAALNGSPVRVLQASDFKELKRGTITVAELPERCLLRLKLQGDGQAETIPLRELHFVQGDGFTLDIAYRTGAAREYIIGIGEERYAETARRLMKRATVCGAKLVGPPPLVTTGR